MLDQLLDEADALNRAAAELPRPGARPAAAGGDGGHRRPARRLARRLRRGDPVAARVKLRRADVAGSVLRALPGCGMTALGADPADLRAVEAIVRRAGTSFYRGMRILPPDRRLAMYAIYAFCRLVDDVADEPAPMAAKQAGLAGWRDASPACMPARRRRGHPGAGAAVRASACGRRTSRR